MNGGHSSAKAPFKRSKREYNTTVGSGKMDELLEATATSSEKGTHVNAPHAMEQSANATFAKNQLHGKRTTRKSVAVLQESAVADAVALSEDAATASGSLHGGDGTGSMLEAVRAAGAPQIREERTESLVEGADGVATTTIASVSVLQQQEQKARDESERAVIDFIHNGGSVTAAAAKFGLSRAEVSKIMKDDAADSTPASGTTNTTTTTTVAAVAENGQQESGSDSDATEEDDSLAANRAASEIDQPARSRKRKAVENDQVAGEATATSLEASPLTPSMATHLETVTTTAALDSGSKTKRVRKSKEEKLAILHFVEQGGTHVAAAERFGISRTAVTKMVKDREVIWSKAARSVETTGAPTTAAAMATTTTPSSPAATALETSSSSVPAGATQQALFPASADIKVTHTRAAADTSVDADTSMAVSTVSVKDDGGVASPINAAAPAAPASRKGRRVRKTNVEKLEILAFVEQGGSQGAAAEKFGVSRTAVTKMVKEKEAISAQAHSDSTNHRKVLQYQHKLSIIEDMLYKWQVQVEFEAPTLKVTGDLLQSKAMEFRNKILADFSSDLPDEVVVSLTDFKASNGWLHRYTQRRNVRSLSKSEHHSISADPSYVEKRMERIRNQLTAAHVPLHCIWNIDEAVIRHRTTSSRSDASVNLDSRSQEKFIVTFSTSAAGEKLNLQVIGGNNQPASLKDIDPLLALGVHYHGQRKACQDSSTVMHFVNLMNHEARSRKQVWHILLDNCPSHMAAATILDPNGSYDAGFKVDSVVLIVLPPNSVSSLQPLQLGVIRSFKVAFRREMLHTILGEYATWESSQQSGDKATAAAAAPFDVHSFTHTRNALLWLQGAWNSASATSIRQAWAKSNYLPAHLLPEVSDDLSRPLDSAVYAEFVELLSVLATKKELLNALGLDTLGDTEQVAMELINLDEPEVSGSDDVNDDEIVMESLSAQGLIRDSHRIHGALVDSTPDITSISDACGTVEKLLRFMDKTNYEQLPATDRRTGRSNLLALHRILLKARAKERSSTAYTV